MDNLFLDELADPINLGNIKEIQINNNNNIFHSNDNIVGEIEDYDLNPEAIIHKQENISQNTNNPSIYDIGSLFSRNIIYKNIILSNIEHNKYDKNSNKIIYNLSDSYSNIYYFKNVIGFRLSEFIMNMPILNINNELYFYNHTNSIDKSISNSVVTINKGYYTIYTLLNEINTQISTNASGTFTYNNTSNIVSWNSTNASNIEISQDVNGLLSILGFDNNTLHLATDQNASHNPNLLVGSFIDISIEEIPIEACKQTCMGKNIISRIPLLTNTNNSIIYYDNKRFNCNYEANNLFFPKSLNKLSISLFIDNKEFNLSNLDYSFEFELTILNR